MPEQTALIAILREIDAARPRWLSPRGPWAATTTSSARSRAPCRTLGRPGGPAASLTDHHAVPRVPGRPREHGIPMIADERM